MAKPFITVLVDTYNHERFIEQALSSVVEQDFPASEMEILVVDDGSTDRTSELVRRFEPRVRLIRKENGGQASAFNVGISEARGEIVAFLDGDDWWKTDKLKRVTDALAADDTLGIVGHGIVVVSRDGSEQSETLRDGFRFCANTLGGARLLRRRGSFLGTSRMTIRTRVLKQIGPVPERIRVQADEYLSTLAAVLGGCEILDEALTYYRLHELNAFQDVRFGSPQMRNKQESLAILARSLAEQIKKLGVDERTCRTVVEYTEASANQLRLAMCGGWPWETVRAEWPIYRVTHPDAPLSHRAFKALTLLAALAIPPKFFYKMQRTLAQSGLYRRVRKRVLPAPEMLHIQKTTEGRS